MQVATLGLNHKSAPLAVREVFSAAASKLEKEDQWKEASLVIISTCNRTEVYFAHTDLTEMHSQLLASFRTYVKLPFEHHLYSYFGLDAFRHLARVITGLDSALIGECEIQRQGKKAYENAKEERLLYSQLHFMFQKSFRIGKMLRSRFSMAEWSLDLPRIVTEIIKTSEEKKILFVGYSEINRRIMSQLALWGYELSLKTNVEKCDLPKYCVLHDEALPWRYYGVVIFGTYAERYLLTCSEESYPKVVIDLGVPRNVDPLVETRRGIKVHNIDELTTDISEKKERVAAEIALCERALNSMVDRQKTLYYMHRSKTEYAVNQL